MVCGAMMIPDYSLWEHQDQQQCEKLLQVHGSPPSMPKQNDKLPTMSSSSYGSAYAGGVRGSSLGREYRPGLPDSLTREYRQMHQLSSDSSSGREYRQYPAENYLHPREYRHQTAENLSPRDYRPTSEQFQQQSPLVGRRSELGLEDMAQLRYSQHLGNGHHIMQHMKTRQSYTSLTKDQATKSKSIFRRIKVALKESEDKGEFLRRCVTILCTSFWIIIPLGLSSALPISMFIVGTSYLDQCPAEKFVPIFMLVAGISGILVTLVPSVLMITLIIMQRLECKPLRTNDPHATPLTNCIFKMCPLLAFVNILGLMVFVAGNVWVYRLKNKFNAVRDEPGDPIYCDPWLYNYAFWVISSCYVVGSVLSVILLIICCLSIRNCNRKDKLRKTMLAESTV
ncbi:uncharacterized protein LOC141906342 [Tubulanus polymorphus]|uniref:uncharacterized protein LOC141906342 n=1 Tax=Tubulanus polymorphus TaxID=672921 RepID=UPI003DA401EC